MPGADDQSPTGSPSPVAHEEREMKKSIPRCDNTKYFHDTVHTHMKLPSICFRIMNTPQFQRLRNLKQLGACYYVYPSAAHNRFEHCVGTSYLAGTYVKLLRENQPEWNISDDDVLCLYVAGLCHDLGHGPFSHGWEKFLKSAGVEDYKHEEMSLKMFDYLLESNDLKHFFKDEDIVFIKEIILGHAEKGKEFPLLGRDSSKHFLYQIVSNEETKIDVDKFDYLLRDCKQLRIGAEFDYKRVMINSRVVDVDGKTKIAYRYKVDNILKDLFQSRFSMHRKAYQHRVTKTIEEMMVDGLKEADKHYKVKGANGKEYKLSEAHQDVSAFMKLSDSIFELIVHENRGGPRASEIFDQIIRRDLYPFLGSFSAIGVEKDALEKLEKLQNVRTTSSKINYGAGKKNPLNNALFYEKNSPVTHFQAAFPDAPEEAQVFILYCKAVTTSGAVADVDENENVKVDASLEEVGHHVNQWAEKYKIQLRHE